MQTFRFTSCNNRAVRRWTWWTASFSKLFLSNVISQHWFFVSCTVAHKHSDTVIYLFLSSGGKQTADGAVANRFRCIAFAAPISHTSAIGRSHEDTGYAFISSRLDYCNSLLFGTSNNVLWHVQAVQNASASLVTGTRRREHITLVL